MILQPFTNLQEVLGQLQLVLQLPSEVAMNDRGSGLSREVRDSTHHLGQWAGLLRLSDR